MTAPTLACRRLRQLQLPRKLYRCMASHVARQLPREACGFLAGQGELVTRWYPVRNVATQTNRFLMDAQEQVQAMLDAEVRGLQLLAIYHSHPDGSPFPSAVDLRLTAYPDLLLVVLAPTGGNWECRAFRLKGKKFEELPLLLL